MKSTLMITVLLMTVIALAPILYGLRPSSTYSKEIEEGGRPWR
jgi:hypothetical protein